jgi:hypothetical protein
MTHRAQFSGRGIFVKKVMLKNNKEEKKNG